MQVQVQGRNLQRKTSTRYASSKSATMLGNMTLTRALGAYGEVNYPTELVDDACRSRQIRCAQKVRTEVGESVIYSDSSLILSTSCRTSCRYGPR